MPPTSSSATAFPRRRCPSLIGATLRQIGLGLLLLGSSNLSHAVDAPPAVTTDLQTFWETPPDLRQTPQTVRFEIDVDYYDPEWKMIWGRCQNRGYYIASGDTPLAIKTGQRILAEGNMVPAVGLSLANAKLTVVESPSPVPPLPVNGQIGNIAKLQNQIVSIEGYVERQTRTDAHHILIDILCDNMIVRGTTVVTDQQQPPNFLDLLVRVSGVYVAKTTQSGQLAQLDLWIPRIDDVQTIGSIKDDPRFINRSITRVENLIHLSEENEVLVSGIVHEFQQGKSVTLRDATGQVKIISPQIRSISNGTVIEAIGKPSISGNNWLLHDGHYRVINPPADTNKSYDGPLRLAEQVLTLSREKAGTGLPVKLSGVVTWVRGSANYIYLQDASGGIRLRLPPSIRPSRDMLYSLMEVTGTTAEGNFAPEILASELVSIGKESVPAPRAITLDQAMTGIEESQSVEMIGYLREVKREGNWSELSLTSASGEFTVRLPAHEELAKLKGATVRVIGVCVAQTNERHELTGITLLTPNHDCIQVEEPAPADPFAIPSRTIASLRRYSPIQAFNHRVRVVGQVIQQAPGRYLHIQDGASGLLVLSRGTEPLKLGDAVEFSGLPGRDSNRLVLREAVYRRFGDGLEPKPAEITAAGNAVKDLDGQLVQAEGRLLEANHGEPDSTLLLQTAAGTFAAKLEDHDFPLPLIGAELKVTGVYLVDFDEYRQPRTFHIRLRAPTDIVVLKNPSWLTASHALAVAGLLGGIVLLTITWLSILRRRVNQQTARIREQLEKEAALEARHSDIVENASDFIFTLDQAGRFTSFNAAGERITGYPRAQALQLNIRDLIAPDHADQPLPIFGLQAELDGTVTFQTRFKTQDGRLLWIETNARLIRQHGQAPGILGVARDITDRKQIEEELRRARDAAEANTKSKSVFLANMSHEIRTPMNGVIGMSNLLLNTPLNDEQRDFAETIRHSAESLLTILNDILDFSKIEAGKLHFDRVDFDLPETVEITLELLAARAAEKGIELASYLPQSLPRHLRGDPGRLRQILLNLVGNAIKFTAQGEVILAVAVEKETDHDVRLLFEITDTGPGVDATTQGTLFQPFQQADSSTTRKFGGTGLGLAISKQIVNLMEGQIGVRSIPGKGSTFWFTLLLEKQPSGATHAPLTNATALKGLRTLIVDDNATNRKILQHYSAGWELRDACASSGAAALATLRAAALAHDPFNLILLDYQMPEMDGLMLAREIQRDPTLSGARLILLTSWDRRFSREELAEHGIIRMLVKPIRQLDLLGALLRCVHLGFATLSNDALRSVAPMAEIEPAERTHSTVRPLRILVAEDNLVNQRVSRMQLKNLGHAVEIAANGVEVLELLARGSYDAIFMDCQMPELDGYDTTRQIRQHPVHAKIRIVAMTANAMQGDRERCLDAGMDDYVTKPTRPEDLAAALARCAAALESKPANPT